MSTASWVQFIVFAGVTVVTAVPIGLYMARVFGDDGQKAPGARLFGPGERFISRIWRIDATREQRWTTYA